MYWTGWYSREDEKHYYKSIRFEGDHFDMATEVSTSTSSLSSSLPGVYETSRWSMSGRELLDVEKIIEIHAQNGVSDLSGKLMSISVFGLLEEPIKENGYTVSKYLRAINDFKPRGFKEYGQLYLDESIEYSAFVDESIFNKESKWDEKGGSLQLQLNEVVGLFTEYLQRDFNAPESVKGYEVTLQRADFTDFWIYEVRVGYGNESRLSGIRGFVTLDGKVVPFVKE